jgi:four helix bundle protein
LKELRGTKIWLRLIQQITLITPAEKLDNILQEIEELIRIFVTSIKTAQMNKCSMH